MRRSTCVFLLFAVGLILPRIAPAQLELDDLPAAQSASRFFTDRLSVIHPGLSLNGFDCSAPDRTCNEGFGLKQVLEGVYAPVPDYPALEAYNRVLKTAAEPLAADPATRSHVLQNVHRLQSRAFAALATYVLEEHGLAPEAPGEGSEVSAAPSHGEALDRFTAAARQPELFQINPAFNADGVKWTRAVTSFARAVDLYLALENAYLHYAGNESSLLSCEEKLALLNGFRASMRTLEGMGGDPISELAGLTPYEVQSGNWPLRLQVALGYAALTQQISGTDNTCGTLEDIPSLETWFSRAVRSAGMTAGVDRRAHWAYQTGGGQPFWAEGAYYFHLIIEEVVPFWHAARINGMLAGTGEGTMSDPFHSPWFLQPLEWMAHSATPDGMTPPLDDGNKQELYNSSVLDWRPSYGDGDVGQKYASIRGRIPEGRSHNEFVDLVAMAIPRVPTAEDAPPSSSPDPGRPELVVHRAAEPGQQYLLMNVERGAAVHRGEGHEQGDPLQLLYYVDDVSYLLDSGYDSAEGLTNSRWNHYFDHNVMLGGKGSTEPNEGGVLPPTINIFCPCISSARMHEVDGVEYVRSGRIDILTGAVPLESSARQSIARNRRTVLYIDDPAAPYVIDLNAARELPAAGTGTDEAVFEMVYHGSGPEVEEWTGGDRHAVLWKGLYGRERGADGTRMRTDNHLLIHPFSVEGVLETAVAPDVARELYSRENVVDVIQRLSIYGPGAVADAPDDAPPASHTTVAFIRAFPAVESPQEKTIPAVRAGRSDESYGPREWQYFYRHAREDMIDVFVARAARAASVAENRESVDFTVAETKLPLSLPAEAEYGFVRLARKQGVWTVSHDYRVNIRAEKPTAARDAGLPAAYRLHANYPNPFNPSTTIEYDLPEESNVVLNVYNVSGELVARLVDDRLQAGTHRLVWNAGDRASGVYVLRMRARGAGDEFNAVRTMMLVK